MWENLSSALIMVEYENLITCLLRSCYSLWVATCGTVSVIAQLSCQGVKESGFLIWVFAFMLI